jgi:hypothetical protein
MQIKKGCGHPRCRFVKAVFFFCRCQNGIKD